MRSPTIIHQFYVQHLISLINTMSIRHCQNNLFLRSVLHLYDSSIAPMKSLLFLVTVVEFMTHGPFIKSGVKERTLDLPTLKRLPHSYNNVEPSTIPSKTVKLLDPNLTL